MTDQAKGNQLAAGEASHGAVHGPDARPAFAQERRKHPRFACEGRAEIFLPHAGLRIAGSIADLSLAGCFIEAPAVNLERGTQVEVYFEANRLPFRVAGSISVVYRGLGAGIAFLRPNQRTARCITELIKELEGG